MRCFEKHLSYSRDRGHHRGMTGHRLAQEKAEILDRTASRDFLFLDSVSCVSNSPAGNAA